MSTCDLDVAGGEVRIDDLGRARDDLALGPEDELVADLVRERRGLRCDFRVDDQLDEAALVAEVDEDQTAVVSTPRDPARERDSPPDVLAARSSPPWSVRQVIPEP